MHIYIYIYLCIWLMAYDWLSEITNSEVYSVLLLQF